MIVYANIFDSFMSVINLVFYQFSISFYLMLNFVKLLFFIVLAFSSFFLDPSIPVSSSSAYYLVPCAPLGDSVIQMFDRYVVYKFSFPPPFIFLDCSIIIMLMYVTIC